MNENGENKKKVHWAWYVFLFGLILFVNYCVIPAANEISRGMP